MDKPEQLIETKVRMSKRMRHEILRRAKKSGRSFSAEAVDMLERASRAEETERQFTELKQSIERQQLATAELAAKWVQRSAMWNEQRAIWRELDRLRSERRDRRPPPSPEERALLDRMEEASRELERLRPREEESPEERALRARLDELADLIPKKDEPS
jgi:hypothetical protein